MVKVLEKNLSEPLPFVTLKHLAMDAIRRWRRQTRMEPLPKGFEDLLEAKEGTFVVVNEGDIEEIEALMREARLLMKEGRFIYLRFYEGLSLRECRERLGVSSVELLELRASAFYRLRSAVWRREMAREGREAEERQ